ncbi:glycoside hydrolase superfamily [Ilyonectria sp. MPI-CAGE-AT-0026]|nr:glycoside hydrolase superfamily [Ilyonectria sp. MPI-CAGE-AT-0026]
MGNVKKRNASLAISQIVTTGGETRAKRENILDYNCATIAISHGKCRITDDFCIIAKAATDAPGITAAGKNSSWNSKRECLNIDVNEIDKFEYTHIHFVFADVTSTYTIDVSGYLCQFNLFKAITGIKKIISFGGWDFSTMLRTYNILRETFKPANRAMLISNIAAFVKKHDLDGVELTGSIRV